MNLLFYGIDRITFVIAESIAIMTLLISNPISYQKVLVFVV